MASIQFLPSVLSILPPIFFRLLLVQIYTLWTHTVLTYPSSKSLWHRIPPFKATLCATGPALALLLAARAGFIVVAVYATRSKGRGHGYLGVIAANIYVAVLEAITEIPARIVLTRVQASLLPADEKTVVLLDEALRRDGKGEVSEAIGIKEAWRTFGSDAWWRFLVIYVQVFVVSVIGGGVVLATAFLFSIVVMVSASDYINTHN